MLRLLVLALVAVAENQSDTDNESSRKVLGSSVVTSVSVIMDTGNGSKIYADAVGKPVAKPVTPTEIASPINLLNPDHYEFYTFDNSGELIKRLMTLEEIQEIIATGNSDDFTLDSLTSSDFIPEKRVNDVVNNVQNVLKEEMKSHKKPVEKPQMDTPDVSDSWSMILPAIFGNSGEDIKLEPAATHVTPDTIMIEPTVSSTSLQLSTTEKVATLQTQKTTASTTTTTTQQPPIINVEIITHSNSTTEKTIDSSSDASQIIEIKPVSNQNLNLELTKDNSRPIYHVNKKTTTTKKPAITAKPVSSTTTKMTSIAATTATKAPITVTTTTTKAPTTVTTTTTKAPITETTTTTTTTTATPSTSKTTLSTTTPKIVTTTDTPTTLESTTTESPSTTIQDATTSKIKLPTLLQILNDYQTTDSDPEETTTTESSSTYSPLSTFFIVSDNKNYAIDNKTTTDSADDLSTLSTEYITVKTVNKDKIPNSSFASTTESESTVKTTQLLDQFLLTSTNIYEINSELSLNPDYDLDSTPESSTKVENETTENPSTTTDQNFLQSIETLISQAVAPIEVLVDNKEESTKVESVIKASANKTMIEVLKESATIASNLMDLNQETTTESVFTTTEVASETTTTEKDVLSDSVEALLSQIYNSGSTTINYYSTTTDLPETTTNSPATTTFKHETTTASQSPHIINITIIRNENKKPAKADLSLEMEYEDIINELKLNSSRQSNSTEDNQTQESTNSVQNLTTTDANFETTTDLTTNSSYQNESEWTLVSTVAPHDVKIDATTENPSVSSTPVVDLVPKPLQGFGLEDSTSKLDSDVYQFVQLCNELAFGFWRSVTTGISAARSVFVSPFAATSLLAMVFLGARGSTSGEMNEILKLDDMVTFNPHLIFKNVSESIEISPDSGVAVSTIIRELYSDRSKGKLLGFYKERVKQFYDGHVEEASFKEIEDVIRRRTNLLVKKNTDGKIQEFLKGNVLSLKPPLAGVSVSVFETDCSSGSTEGRDGELHFVVLPSIRQRRLIPIPATVYRSGFLAGYEPSLDATAAALGTKDQTISTIFIIPGQQRIAAPGDNLSRLEKRLVESSFKKGAWARLLRSLIPRPGVELQIPRFLHRSVINTTESLKKMGLYDLFDSKKANLKGLNSAAHELHLSDVVQVNEFATCGEGRIAEGETHHQEIYPATADRRRRSKVLEMRDYERAFRDPLHDPTFFNLPLQLRPRQARLPEIPRLRFDRPFLYFVRHNPTGLILHMGRFHPRLLP